MMTVLVGRLWWKEKTKEDINVQKGIDKDSGNWLLDKDRRKIMWAIVTKKDKSREECSEYKHKKVNYE